VAPEWWVEAQFAAEERHDPDQHGGRDWDDLSYEEQETAIYAVLEDIGDGVSETRD